MIACILIPGFELRAALLARPGLALRPAALAPMPGKEALLGPVTATAEAGGIRPGMRLGEALATCPALVLVDPDPAGVEREWEGVLRRLEDAAFSIEPDGPGCLYLDTRGVERLYGGVDQALKRALASVGSAWDPRVGAAMTRFTALAAASIARPGQIVRVDEARTHEFLAPLSLDLVPLPAEQHEELRELGIRRLGDLAGLPEPAVTDRFGPQGHEAWRLARGGHGTPVTPRTPPLQLNETLRFPDAVGNELTLRRALQILVDSLLARQEREGRPPRKLALAARLASGGSWRRTLTLREPSAEPLSLRGALWPKLADLPGPIVALRLEIVELAATVGWQLELVNAEGAARQGRLSEGIRQARASAGQEAVCTVVEVAPWSRIPESRALLVPREE
jgi:protein ImuB